MFKLYQISHEQYLSSVPAEADFEADELAEAPTLEDGTFDLEQEQQPTRSGEAPVVFPSTEDEAMCRVPTSVACCCRRAKEKQNRLRADIDLQGAAYSGKRTSRAAAFDAASSSGESAADRYILMHAALTLHTACSADVLHAWHNPACVQLTVIQQGVDLSWKMMR